MHDASSYELVSFYVYHKSSEYSKYNRMYLDTVGSKYDKGEIEQRVFFDALDSIYDVEESLDENFRLTKVQIKIRGNNKFGAKVLSEHFVFYSNNTLNSKVELHSVDGERVY